ncbi:MAG TPA: ATP-binding protein [Desulfomonilia bacterium]|nr:ATP-binding protein [Desulfomonilia bacterium]
MDSLMKNTFLGRLACWTFPGREAPKGTASSLDLPLNPLSLSFSGNLEREYLDDFFNKSLKQVRLILVSGIVFYGIFGFLDAKLIPGAKETLWLIRYAVVIPCILGVILFSFSSRFKPYMQMCLATAITVSGLGIVIMILIAPPPANYSYYAGLILVLIFGYVFLRIRFIWAAMAGWTIVAFYEVASIWLSATPVEILLNNNFFILSANVIGMFACYSSEYYSRRDFYLVKLLEVEQEKVKAANMELEERVKERTSQLMQSNEELVREIEAHRKAEEEKKGLEHQLRQAQKMEAIGTLAGGIAHDFNNILSPIIGYSEMIIEDVPARSPLKNKTEQILTAATRAKELVRHILTFSRQTEQELIPLELHPIIKESLTLLRASLPKTIEIKQKVDTNCKPVLADPTQIHQVLINLCTNAFHAMRDKGGTLGVEMSEVEIGAADCMTMKLNPGRYVKICVSDTGHGIPKNIMERVFDPYFTTKAPGEGTGLGLSVVHGIVKSYQGEIKIYSEAGKGTTVSIYLPCLEVETSIRKGYVQENISGGKESILVVDDEEYIITMMKEMLERLGYRVTAFTDSSKAFGDFRRDPYRYDLIITDQTMPRLTGTDLAEECMRIRPDLPVIICTGFSEILSEEKAKAIGISEYVTKPVVKSEISRAIRNALSSRRS